MSDDVGYEEWKRICEQENEDRVKGAWRSLSQKFMKNSKQETATTGLLAAYLEMGVVQASKFNQSETVKFFLKMLHEEKEDEISFLKTYSKGMGWDFEEYVFERWHDALKFACASNALKTLNTLSEMEQEWQIKKIYPLIKEAAWIDACTEGHLESMKWLLNHRFSKNELRSGPDFDPWGQNMLGLRMSVRFGHENVVNFFLPMENQEGKSRPCHELDQQSEGLRNKWNSLNQIEKNKRIEQWMDVAAQHGHEGVVKYLIKYQKTQGDQDWNPCQSQNGISLIGSVCLGGVKNLNMLRDVIMDHVKQEDLQYALDIIDDLGARTLKQEAQEWIRSRQEKMELVQSLQKVDAESGNENKKETQNTKNEAQSCAQNKQDKEIKRQRRL